MSAVEETKKDTVVRTGISSGKGASALSPLSWLLNLLSSVRFGVTLLVLLVAASMVGMLIMQQNVDGFDRYYAELTPSQKLLYGGLGFFDIYHSWYFNALLLVLSLNIILASIDRFPKTWKIVSRRKLEAGRKWLAAQQHHAAIRVEGESASAVAARLSAAMRSVGLKPTVTEKDGRAYVFGERGAWNRLGYLAVHVALLTIFTGGFLTAQFGRDGQMPLMPGSSTSEMTNLTFQLDQVARVPVPLPFTVTCTDIQQKLIKKDGSIQANNTIDWLTRIRIKDERGEREALVHLNTPYDYRGYRFFQASFISFGQARNITLRLTPQDGSAPFEVTIGRGGSVSLPDGTRIVFDNFQPDFTIGPGGKPDSQSGDYNNPAAVLNVTTPANEQKTVYAFAMELPSGAPVGAPFGGYKYRLVDFEKVPLQHVLAVQRDPGKIPFYAGGLMLIASLGSVFFFSHRRVWAMIEHHAEGGYEVILGGNTNRNKLGFEDRFKRLVGLLGGKSSEVEQS
ncbi:MAG TPA: cytochrome c biogenesis protein ResB [Pyrinomonadaceae bacterium]|nr:cytochrome c biogenesis protein ResB [Pyrinomonadaceae bacterium]